jgi:hypothetical protein
MEDIIKKNLKNYLEKLLIIKENGTQSYFLCYDEQPISDEKKIGYETECPIDEYQISKVDKEIERIKEKIKEYDECNSYYFIKFPSKINIQTKK